MGKLPKSMQKKKKAAKELRSKGSVAKTSNKRAPPINQNRQMRRRLKQQGIGDMDQIEANRVIIQTDSEDLVIESPQVIKVNQQGMEVYQVIGSAETFPSGSYGQSDGSGDIDDTLSSEDRDSDLVEDELTVEITEQDIQLVAMQTNVSPEVAAQALKETNGDLAKAIINLKMR
ncbi:MAG: nascent polypeptide-associated complex protein [Promethearchaeota archaeon]